MKIKPTMTVKQLQDILANYPADAPVYATWEGCLAVIIKENFELEALDSAWVGKGPRLVIDVGELI